jgi:dipeptidase E
VLGTIVTLGGGGFSMSDEGSSDIDDHLLELTGKARPRVCFVGTASGDAASYCERFFAAFDGRAHASALTLFPSSARGYTDPSMLLDQDLIYVGGGSTANLLAVWRTHGIDSVMRTAAAGGTVLAGISAGMNCWFEASSTDSFGRLTPLNDGLAFLTGSACPHYLSEDGRDQRFREWIASGDLPSGHAATDGVALVWRDGSLAEAISERPDGEAFIVTPVGQTPIPARRLRP